VFIRVHSRLPWLKSMENVKLEKKNHLAHVTIDRPKVLNALNIATMHELWQAFSAFLEKRAPNFQGR
jgi:enoyl-CoA hydratase/carnithine racemase